AFAAANRGLLNMKWASAGIRTARPTTAVTNTTAQRENAKRHFSSHVMQRRIPAFHQSDLLKLDLHLKERASGHLELEDVSLDNDCGLANVKVCVRCLRQILSFSAT